jgi:hypothetical protein
MHIIKLIERRFPRHKTGITAVSLLLSLSLLLIGVGVLLLQ